VGRVKQPGVVDIVKNQKRTRPGRVGLAGPRGGATLGELIERLQDAPGRAGVVELFIVGERDPEVRVECADRGGEAGHPRSADQPAASGVEVGVGKGVLDCQGGLAQPANAMHRADDTELAQAGGLVQPEHFGLAADEAGIMRR